MTLLSLALPSLDGLLCLEEDLIFVIIPVYMPEQSTPSRQPVKVCFFEFKCWKCTAQNHIYYAAHHEDPALPVEFD